MAAITEKATLGQAVIFNATLERKSYGDKRWWAVVNEKQRRGIIVGTRTLWNGHVHTEVFDEEDGGGYWSTFVQEQHHQAFLVAYALNRKPVLVPFENLIAE